MGVVRVREGSIWGGRLLKVIMDMTMRWVGDETRYRGEDEHSK